MPDLRCSFCGKRPRQISSIIGGPGVAICADCVRAAVELLEQREVTLPSPDQASLVQAAGASGQEIQRLHEVLDSLAQVDRDVVAFIWGVHDRRPHAISEAAQRFGLTHAHVDAILWQAQARPTRGAESNTRQHDPDRSGPLGAPPYTFTNRAGTKYCLFHWPVQLPGGAAHDPLFFAREEYLQFDPYRQMTVASLPQGITVVEDLHSGMPLFRQTLAGRTFAASGGQN